MLREGTVAECGTHDELMRRGGYYSELYRAQFDAAQDAADHTGRRGQNAAPAFFAIFSKRNARKQNFNNRIL